MSRLTFWLDFALMLLCSGVHERTLERLLGVKRQWWFKLTAFGACWLIAGMVIFIGDWMNILPTLAGFMAAVYISCEGSRLKRIVVGLMISSTIFSFNAVADNALAANTDMDVFLGARVIFAILLFLGVRKYAPKSGYELTPAMWKLLLLLTLTPIGIVLSVIVLATERYVLPGNLTMYTVLLLLALFSFVGLLWTVSVLAKQKSLEEQNLFAQINRKYYEAMEQQHFEIRRMKHDLANHLQALSALPEEQREGYIRELLENEAITQTLDYCGDATVNAVLTVKEHVMGQQGISFERQINIPGELPIEKADVCALFANALDNAIEALEREKVEKPEILLETRAGKGMFVLSVKNPVGNHCHKEIKPGTTSKPDAKNHGLGLRSIREITERHGGGAEIKVKEGWFQLFLYIPLE